MESLLAVAKLRSREVWSRFATANARHFLGVGFYRVGLLVQAPHCGKISVHYRSLDEIEIEG
jgi:non-ribosomal peptide synthetase component E (peptide arylation enzyme)